MYQVFDYLPAAGGRSNWQVSCFLTSLVSGRFFIPSIGTHYPSFLPFPWGEQVLITTLAFHIWVKQLPFKTNYEYVILSHPILGILFFVFWYGLFCVEEDENGIWKIRPALLPKIDWDTTTLGCIGATHWFGVFHYPTTLCRIWFVNFDVFGFFGATSNQR